MHTASLQPWAVFLDLDGTLTAEHHTVPPANREAIAAVRRMGHKVFLNTGRSTAHLPAGLWEQVEVDGVITGNGAQVVLQGEVRHEACLPEALVRHILEYLFDHRELWALLEGCHGTYAVSRDPEKRKPHQIPLCSPADVEKIYPHDRIQVVAIGEKVPQDFIRRFREELTVIQSDTFADVFRRGTSKAAGMEQTLRLCGIPRERSMAMGDGANDRDMLLFAGIGVAMGNAPAALQEIADHVTASNTDCGVAKALEKFFL